MDKFLDRVKPINIEDEIRSSYLDYSMSVIVGRALPDVRDGLKPVHRRVLYAMSELSNEWNKPHKKSARVVGDVIGKYHPHGDSAVYDALVRMAQPWSLRYPLADGQGNFGSIDGDPPAAMRYTEVRMSRSASEMLADIDKDTVDWQPNYDESTQEPLVLPARVPQLLVNGSSGIAVGMSTNIPPHNMREVIDATIALIDQPGLTSLDLMRYIPGPDFPTAGLIAADDNLRKAYSTGRGIILVRGKAHVEESDRTGRSSLVITEIPYQLNKTRLIENIAELVRTKRIEGVSDIRDESSRKGMRIVLDLKREANSDIILRHLYKHTPLQSSFGIILLAIVNGRPEILTLKGLLRHFIAHRKEVVTRRTRYELRKAEDRAHLLEGFKIALDNLDEVIRTIRSSQSPAEARDRLMSGFGMTERQAQAVLDLRLHRLTAMERDKIIEEYQQILALIERLRALLASEGLLYGLIKEELEEVKAQFGDDRRTEIVQIDTTVTEEDLIPVEDMVVTISHSGYIKRDLLSEYRSQRRGGRGKMGMSTKDEDFVRDLFVATTHSYLLIFTAFGRVHWVKVYELPQVSRTAKGKPIINIVDLQPGDSVAAILPVESFEDQDRTVVVATRQGVVKRTNLADFSRPRAAGVIAAVIDDGDAIIAVRLAEEGQEVLISTAEGMAIRFAVSDVRVMGRVSRGVRGIRLADGDRVIGMETINADDVILTVTARGNGKRTPVSEYRFQSRAGQGVIDIKTGDRNGEVVGMTRVAEQDHVLLITDSGKIIRTPVRDIRLIGRNTWGVSIIRLDDEQERVTGLALVQEGDEEEGDGEDEGSASEGLEGSEVGAGDSMETAAGEDEDADG